MADGNVRRREFLRKTVGAIAGVTAFPMIVPATVISRPGNVAPSDKIFIGFIGIGKQGGGLLRGFLHIPEMHVVAVCDVDALKLQQAKDTVEKQYSSDTNQTYTGCDAYKDFRQIIERKDIDAVVIATPDHWHAIPSIMAAKAGKDIYCEKPLSLTIGEARQMVEAVRRYNRVFQTGSMQRSDNKFRFACELVQNGYIGDIKKVRVSIRTGFVPHPLPCALPPQDVPAELDWDMWLGPAPVRPYNSILAPPATFNGWPSWRDYRDYSGGGMTDWGAHHFDIAQWGLGMDHSGPVEIYPPDGKDFQYLTYFYKNGVELSADFDDNYILFTGTEGEIKVNRQYLQTKPASLINVKLRPNEIHLYNSNDHRKDWLQAIHARTKPICNVEIGCRSVTVCHLGNLAVQLDRPLKWDPGKEEFINDAEANRLKSRAKRSPWQV